jgi:hypothetical protein
MELQSLDVMSMSEEQLCSFATKEFVNEYDQPLRFDSYSSVVCWVTQFLDVKTRTDFSMESIKASIQEEYPDRYHFDGYTYIPCLKTYHAQQEEKQHTFERKSLPLLGCCKIYPTLKRIVHEVEHYEFIGQEPADENIDFPNFIGTCHERRVSFDEYQKMLCQEKAKIEETLEAFSKLG